jgi:hypothetical protein
MTATTVEKIPGLAQIGESQRNFSMEASSKAEELRETGQCKPFTVVNFNPVPVDLSGELKRYRIPTADDDRLPKEVSRISFEWGGQIRRGHALTISEPHMYGRNAGAHSFNGNQAMAIPEREVQYFLPVAIAYHFLEHYSTIFVAKGPQRVTAPPKDRKKIFGLLVFEGNLRALEETNLNKNGRMIRVPVAREMQNRKRMYSTIEYNFDDYLDEMFSGQLKYADTVVSRAQAHANEGPEGMKEIGSNDRLWLRWAMQFDETLRTSPAVVGNKAWLNDLMSLRGATDRTVDARRKCQACRAIEPEVGTPFCPKCNAPIDTFDTFMAGFPVSESWLQTLKGERREQALNEYHSRSAGFVGGAKRERGPYKEPRAAAPVATAEEIPALPGEELTDEELEVLRNGPATQTDDKEESAKLKENKGKGK